MGHSATSPRSTSRSWELRDGYTGAAPPRPPRGQRHCGPDRQRHGPLWPPRPQGPCRCARGSRRDLSSPQSPACQPQISGHLRLHNRVSQFLIYIFKKSLSLYMHTHSVSLKKPDTDRSHYNSLGTLVFSIGLCRS